MERQRILDEFCAKYSYHRYAIRLLNGPPPGPRPMPRRALGAPRGVRRLDGRTKAGHPAEAPHPFPVKTNRWETQAPGFTDVDPSRTPATRPAWNSVTP